MGVDTNFSQRDQYQADRAAHYQKDRSSAGGGGQTVHETNRFDAYQYAGERPHRQEIIAVDTVQQQSNFDRPDYNNRSLSERAGEMSSSDRFRASSQGMPTSRDYPTERARANEITSRDYPTDRPRGNEMPSRDYPTDRARGNEIPSRDYPTDRARGSEMPDSSSRDFADRPRGHSQEMPGSRQGEAERPDYWADRQRGESRPDSYQQRHQYDDMRPQPMDLDRSASRDPDPSYSRSTPDDSGPSYNKYKAPAQVHQAPPQPVPTFSQGYPSSGPRMENVTE